MIAIDRTLRLENFGFDHSFIQNDPFKTFQLEDFEFDSSPA